nr:uracil-DNA glycosylase [uncultured Flavobacterium sp.]
MEVPLNASWKQLLQAEFEKPYFEKLMTFILVEYTHNRCYPPKELIFSALNNCNFEDIKIVILGQDPYHGLGQANGLCFSVNDGISFPPSLVNIFKELEADLTIPIAISGNLERWAKQGILMLNTTLTVREGEAGSHQNKGWEEFTDAIIKKINDEKKGVIFLLWGGFAKRKGAYINKEKHLVLESGHPSPLSANRGLWFGNKHFSKSNSYLVKTKRKPIDW